MGHTTKISDYELERGDWIQPCEGYDVEAQAESESKQSKSAPKKTQTKKTEPEEEVEEVDVESLTVEELRAQLDELGVDYAASDRKADLQEKLYDALG